MKIAVLHLYRYDNYMNVFTGCLLFVYRVFQFSDDEEETKRVVRSAKDKRYSKSRHVFVTGMKKGLVSALIQC